MTATRAWLPAFLLALLGGLLLLPPSALAGPCDPPNNEVVCENSKAGTPPSVWDVNGAGASNIQGFATEISVDRGETIEFKVNTPSSDYRLDIYRMGWYGGDGARKVATVQPSAGLPQSQPSCDLQPSSGLVDCGKWGVSASWAVPAGAVSGIYFAKLEREDTSSEGSHIVFVVRDDEGESDLLFQTSDTTWQAYNEYGSNSLYTGGPGESPGRAYKVSYNRPLTVRQTSPEDSPFNAEYPMVRWLERNGYEVSYTSGVDSDRAGEELLEHEAFLSVGHDEYWSGEQRANVEAARDAGVDLAFFSGNEIFWKTRWEQSIDGSGDEYRTLVSYKDTHADESIDPEGPETWTGTWRDPRFSPPGDGGRPENELSGTAFMVNAGTTEIEVPAADGALRFWRGTDIAALEPGQTATLGDSTLGYEWDEDLDNGFRPAGLVRLSSTTTEVPQKLLDHGNTYGAGTATHHLTLYRAESGALVFGAGTVQWSWGLDSEHDRGEAPPDARMQQATVNLFADMGVQPGTLQAGLVAATASSDGVPPGSTIATPADGGEVELGEEVTVTGTAADSEGESEAGGEVGGVEVSVDGGETWHPAEGRNNWSYTWFPEELGETTILSRAADDSGNLEPSPGEATVEVVELSCPCSIWNETVTGTQDPDVNAVELGVKFRSEVPGYISGLRFYKTAGNTGTHSGRLWTQAGTQLAQVTFSGETATGWQEAKFDTPVEIEAGTTYIASYHAPSGRYASIKSYFAVSGFENAPLEALADGFDGPNGIYEYGPAGGLFSGTPNSFQSENYLVDVVFEIDVGPDETPPQATGRSPVPGAEEIGVETPVSATFNEALDPATVNGTTVRLRDGEGSPVAASVSYEAASRRIVLDPDASLQQATTYTATIEGGAGGVRDAAGNPLAANEEWSFTTATPPPPPPDQGPGGPILVISNTSNPFSRYYGQILEAEGLNEYTVADISTIDAEELEARDVAILGEGALSPAQAQMLSDWVQDGGNLIAMRPDADLLGLLGLSAPEGMLGNGYIQVDTGSSPGAGIVAETIQFHGTADRYTASGADTVATLFSDAGTSTGKPALTVREVGPNGGHAAAFTYDLARSIVYTRQGNPAWNADERDGLGAIRSDDLFFGAKAGDPQDDWIDFDKVDIPQADEQQRLLTNLIGEVNLDRKPLPRFWFLPRDEKAAVVMTGDDHGHNGSAGRFESQKALDPPGCSVTEWECVRSTSYIYPNTPIGDAKAAQFVAEGFELALHVTTGCNNWDNQEELGEYYDEQLGAFATAFPSLPAPRTSRTHCIVWSDWASQPKVELERGIRLDTTYYYWPASWVQNRPGMFTGSGMPMRFADLDGSLIDVYQATTQLTDESEQDYPFTSDALLDRALGPEGYYGVFTANMHTDKATIPQSTAIVESALARDVPVVSARQMLTWLDGRNQSSFGSVGWSEGQLSFTIDRAEGADGLRAMVPVESELGPLLGVERGGSPVATTTRTVKGVEYAFFDAEPGAYAASYVDAQEPEISDLQATVKNDGTATVSWQTNEPADSRVDYGTSPGALTESVSDPAQVTSHSLQLTGLDPDATYHFRVTSTDGEANPATEPDLLLPPQSFATPPAAPLLSATDPASPANENAPKLVGSAAPGSTVDVYTSADCTGAPVASGSAATLASPGIAVGVGDDSSTTLRATATSGGGASACSGPISYVEDSGAPQTEITLMPDALSTSTDAGLEFGGDDGAGSGVASFECRRDGGAWTACSSPQQDTGLSEGAHSFEVKAVDQAGNADPTPASFAWTIDSQAPETTIDSAPDALSTSVDAEFAFSGDDGAGTGVAALECRRDGAAWAVCSSPREYLALSQGAHSFEVKAVDQAGNADPSPASFAWTIDSNAPQTEITLEPAVLSTAATAKFEFSGDDGAGSGVASFQCRRDSTEPGDWTACSSGIEYTELSQGAHKFEVRAIDQAGNVDGSPASHEWSIDSQAPQTQITAQPPAFDKSATANFSFDGSDAGGSGLAGFECRRDSEEPEDWQPCVSPLKYTSLAQGPHVVEIRAVDQAGNVDASPAAHEWTIDSGAPQTQIEAEPAALVNSDEASFEFSGDDAGGSGVASFECRRDSTEPGAWAACSSPHLYTGLADGPHKFEVRAIDQAGNADPSPATREWSVDTTPPALSIDSGPEGLTADPQPGFGFSYTPAAGDTLECSIDSGEAAFGACDANDSHAAAAPLANGPYSFRVRATDSAGNVALATRAFEVDATEPETEITLAPAALVAVASASFEFGGEDPEGAGIASFQCKLDDDPFEACASPLDLNGLGEGAHKFEVRAIDLAGNVDATPAAHEWTVDSGAPETQITLKPAPLANSSTAKFEFGGDDGSGSGVASFECRRDSTEPGDWTSCASGVEYTGLSQGAHKFEVRAIDQAGNVDGSPASHEWSIDSLAPETQISMQPPALTGSSKATFEFTGSDPGGSGVASFQCRRDSTEPVGWQLCSSPRVYTSLAEGAHTFEVRAIDNAGSPDPTPATVEWEIDTKAPQTQIDAKPPVLTNATAAKFEFSGEDVLEGSGVASFECKLDAASFAACATGIELTGLSEGAHKFEVRAIDNAGNIDATPASHEWTVDLTPPSVSVDSGPEGLTGNASPTFTFSGEAGATFQCSIDDGTPDFGPCSAAGSHTPAAPLADGPRTFRVRATDVAGNQAIATRGFTVDATGPETQIDLNPAELTASDAATFEFSGDDGAGSGVASFECRRDSTEPGDWTACVSGIEYTGLAEGSHKFEVRAIDNAGNADGSVASHEWTIDLTPPSVSVDTGPEGLTNNPSPTFEFSGEPGASFQCSIDQGTPAFAPCSGSGSHTPADPLANEAFTFRVQATDQAGNPAVATRQFEVNAAVPEAPELSATVPASPANHNTPKVTGTAEAGTEVRIYGTIDCTGAPLGTGAAAELEGGGIEVPVADNSATQLRATVTAPPENTSLCSAPIAYVEDSSAPTTQIDEKPALLVKAATAGFKFSGGDAGGSGVASFECKLDAAPFTACASGIEYTGLSEGSHKFEVRAIDQAGNIDATPAAHEWTVDLTAPAVQVDTGPEGLTSNASPTFAFSGEAGATFECSIDGGAPAFGPCSAAGSHTPAAPLGDGPRIFRVRATDAAGNQATATRGFIVDASAPTTQIDLEPPALTASDAATFEFSGDDGAGSGVASFQCKLDAATFTACSSGIEYTGLSEGSHKFEVRAIDNAGNTDASAAAYEWVVDTEAAQTQISAQPAEFDPSSIATFEFSGDDGAGSGVASFQCKLDAATFTACTSGIELTGLAEGPHKFEVRAIDQAGNVDGTPAAHEWTVDTGAPETQIDEKPAALVNIATAIFEFSGDDGAGSGVASFQCKLDAATFTACTSGIELTGLAEGPHKFEVRAIDQAGNIDPTPASYEWTVDLTAPQVTVDSLSKALLGAGESSELTWHADENGSLQLRAGGADCDTGSAIASGAYSGQPATQLTEIAAADLAEGESILRLCLTDAAGNRGTATTTIEKDSTEPDTQIGQKPAALVNVATATFEFSGSDPAGSGVASFQCKLDSGSFEACSSGIELTGLSEGSHKFEVRALDNAGNIDATPASHEWTLDLTAPAVSVDSGPEGLTNNASPTFEFSGEPGATFQCSIDEGAPDFGPCSAAGSHTPAAPLGDGPHTFRVRATDAAGNQAVATRDFTVDTAAPQAPELLATDPASPANENNPILSGSAPAGTTVALYTGPDCTGASFETVAPAELEAGVEVSVADDSSTAFRATATTAAENSSGCSAPLVYLEDSTEPDTQIGGKPAVLVNVATATFGFSGSDPAGSGIASFQCKLDDGVFEACASGIELTGLSEGGHKFEVRAIDNAGNIDATPASHEWTVDLTPPSVSVDSGPEGLTGNASPTFTFSGEAGATFQCSIDDGTPDFGPCSAAGSHTPAAPLADGPQTFRVQATDAAGNQATAARGFTVDATGPETQIDEKPAELVNVATATFEFSGDDATGSGVASFECRRDSDQPGDWASCSSPHEYTGLADGPHEVEVRAIDNAGNADQSPATYEWTVDTGAPDTQIDEKPAELVNVATATFEFSGTDPAGSGVASFQCKLDGGAFEACASGIELTGLGEGAHKFEVRALDNAGNIDATPASHEWTVDLTAPAVSVDSGPEGLTNNTSPTFAFSGEPGASFQCSIDDGTPAFGPCSAAGSHTLVAPLADGPHTFRVQATDPAGNQAVETRSFTVDATPPSVQVDSGPEGLTNNPSPTFAFSGEPGATFQCSIDDGAPDFGPCSAAGSHTPEAPLGDGPHTFRVRATDAAGNQAVATRDFTVDTAAPQAPELEATDPASPANENSPILSGSAPAGTTVALYTGPDCSGASFDTVTPAELEAGVEVSVVDDSSTAFRATATTAAENTSGCSAPLVYVEDSTEPDTQIGEKPAVLVNAATATFEFSGTDPAGSGVASFQCKLDAATFTACSSGIELTGLSEGSHKFEVRALDNAGNIDGTPASHEWTVDTVAPTTQLDSGPAAISPSANAKFEFSGADAGGSGLASFQCRRDSDQPDHWAACASPRNETALGQGAHKFEVRAIDQAGNVDLSPAIHEWEIDTQAPNTQIGQKPAALVNVPTATFGFSGDDGAGSGIASFQCKLDDASYSACASGIELTGLGEGAHKFEVRALDNAGNIDATPASHEWTVDLTAPAVSVDSGPDGLTNNSSPTFAFSGEPGATFQCSIDDGAPDFGPCSAAGSHTPAAPLADGPQTFRVRATDAAGNQTVATRDFTVDTAAPQTPELLATDPASPANENNPILSGSAPAGTTVALYAAPDCTGAPFETVTSAELESGVEVSVADDSSTAFRATATTAAENTSGCSAPLVYVEDSTEPDTQIDQKPAVLVNTAAATFGFSGSDPAGSGVASFQCKLDDASYSACASGIELTGLGEGAHKFEVRALDNAGNIDATPASYEWAVDTQAPDTQIGQKPAALVNVATATFEFSGDDATGSGVASFECRRDSTEPGDWASCASGIEYTGLSEGSHKFEVRAIDNAGNIDGLPASYEWTIDTVAPTTQIDDAPAAFSASADATFAFSGDAAGGSDIASFQCRRDSDQPGDWVACTSPRNESALGQGSHKFEVRAIDQAGNIDASPAIHEWQIDTQAPSTQIGQKPDDLVNVATATFEFSGTDIGGSGIASFQCKLDAASFTACSTGIELTGLGEGSHKFEVRAIDQAGNIDGTPASHEWTVDLTAPAVSVDSGPEGLTNNASPTFAFSGEAGATFQCSIDDGAPDFGPCSAAGSHTPEAPLADGPHTFRVRATDAAGGQATATREFTVDVTAPETEIDQTPAAVLVDTTATFRFSGNDAGGSGVASFQCRRDGGSWTGCTSPHTYNGLSDGAHSFEVRAIDSLGNVDQSPARFGWVVDSSEPEPAPEPQQQAPAPPTPQPEPEPPVSPESVELLRVQRNVKKGTALLVFKVPGPGLLSARPPEITLGRKQDRERTAKDVRKLRKLLQRRIKPRNIRITRPGQVKVPIELTKVGKKLLARSHRLKVRIVVRFKAPGGSKATWKLSVLLKQQSTRQVTQSRHKKK